MPPEGPFPYAAQLPLLFRMGLLQQNQPLSPPMGLGMGEAAAPAPAPSFGPRGAAQQVTAPAAQWTSPEMMKALQNQQQALSGDMPHVGRKWEVPMGVVKGVENFMAARRGKELQDRAEANERMRSEAVKNAMGATTPDQLVGALQGIPQYADFALQHKFQSVDPAREIELQQKRLALKQAQDDAAWESQLRGGGQQPQPAAPNPPAAPSSVPGISVVPSSPPPTAPAPSAQAAPASTITPAQQDFIQLFRSQPIDEQDAFIKARRKGDVKTQNEITQRWRNPDIEAEKAAKKERGEAQGKAQAALPGAMVSTERMLKKIDDVLYEPDPKNPGKYLPDPSNPGQFMPNKTLSGVTGPLQGKLPTLSGKKRDVEEELKQIQGGVFLEAFQALKGGGAISDAEGKPATQAIARLAALDQSDKGYRKALMEARTEILKLRQLAQDRAAGKIPMPTPQAEAPSSAAAPTLPQPGSVEDGYRFKGGNPGDRSNWEKVN